METKSPSHYSPGARGEKQSGPGLLPLFENKNVSRRQKLYKKVRSLLLETQNNVWGGGSGEASLVTQLVKNPPAMRETWVRSLGFEDPLEKGMATRSSILAWRSPWTV